MIKLTDYIVKYLVEYGVQHVFMVTGGGAMHLNDSFGKYDGISVICNHHEQACAIGAEGYARVTGKLAVVNVTTGPGGLNTLTGVMGQWTDSVPVLYISGQVKYETTVYSCPDLKLRQLGDQEVPIIDVVRPLTKYAAVLENPDDVKKVLDKAVYLATHGRPGPVWIDVPMNVQNAVIDEKKISAAENNHNTNCCESNLGYNIADVIYLLKTANRPVIIAGHGIRLSGAQDAFLKLIDKVRIPVVTSFNGFDIMTSADPNYIGRIGTIGNRAGNFVLQNADVVLCIGSRNNIRQISYNWEYYARAAKKVIVDIDESELKKTTVKADIPVNCDANIFIESMLLRTDNKELPEWHNWLHWCRDIKDRYPVLNKVNIELKDFVDPYYFCNVLSECLSEHTVLVTGNATPSICYFQSGIVKKGQRIFWNSGCAAMGYDLPAAIGACFGSGKKDVICLAGDGSLQMNIQELATVIYHNLPIKLFYLNNGGYASIKQTQDNFFNGRRVGSDENSGVGFPDIIKIAQAYGFQTEMICNHENMYDKIKKVLEIEGPVVCEVKLQHEYIFAPKLSSEKKPDGRIVSKPLEDMYPFLDREEFKNNMIVPIIEE